MSMAPLLGVPGKLKTLLDRLTATRANNLDNLDATMSSRAPSATALSSATWTSGRAVKLDYLDAAISSISPSPIASIQRGQTDPTSATHSVTITAVDTAKSVVNFLGSDLNENAGSGILIYLASSTSLVIESSHTNVTKVSWEVIEYV